MPVRRKVPRRKGRPGKALVRANGNGIALQPKRPKKSSQNEIEERRRDVVRLRMRGLGLRNIAKELGVGHMTIKRDLAAIQEQTKERMSKLDRDIIIAESVSVYEEIETQAWDQFHRCGSGTSMKAQFLNVVRAARNDQIRLLTDIGMITRAPQEVKHTVKTDVISHWSPAAQDIVAMAIIKAGLSQPGAPVPEERQLPEPNVLDVEAEPSGA